MTYAEALKLLESFPKKPGDDWDRHCIGVGDIAWRLALELSRFIDIDPEKVRLFGLVHDFGRSVTQCPYGHSYAGRRLFKELGEDELARICSCHSNGTYRQEDIEKLGLKPDDFFAEKIEEKLIFIADNLESHGKIVRQEVRLEETIRRYQTINPEFVPILKKKISEFRDFDDEIKKITGKSVYEILEI